MTDIDKTHSYPPTQNEMPDLSALDNKLTLNRTLNGWFRQAGLEDHQAKALWINYIRLVDQLVWEYNVARQSLQKYVDKPNDLISLYRCTAHMETCINTIRRAILFARRMRKHRNSPNIYKLTILSDSEGKRLIDMRNAIEHLEGYIREGKIVEGQPFFLLMQNDRVELLGEEIYYSELANWIKQLHTLANELADYRSSDSIT
jgi:hypothetical protein